MISVETSRLDLLPLRAEHSEFMYDGLRDEALYEFIADRPPVTVDALRSRYAQLEGRQSPDGSECWLNWVIRRKDTQEYIGYVQATVYQLPIAEIAYVLFRRHWRQGFARESVLAMIEHLVEFYKIYSFRAVVDRQNARSIRLLEAIKFRRDLANTYDRDMGAIAETDCVYSLSIDAIPN